MELLVDCTFQAHYQTCQFPLDNVCPTFLSRLLAMQSLQETVFRAERREDKKPPDFLYQPHKFYNF